MSPRLILLALGEQTPSRAEIAHLVDCPSCRGELSSTRQVVAIGRDTAGLRDLPPPPAALWDRIATEALGAPVPAPRRAGSISRLSRFRLGLVAAACLVLGVAGTVAVSEFRDRLRSGPAAAPRSSRACGRRGQG